MLSFFLFIQMAWSNSDMPIVPLPNQWEWRQGEILIDQSLEIESPENSARLSAAINRFKSKLPPEEWRLSPKKPPTLRVKCGPMGKHPKLGESESHEITIDDNGIFIYAYECQGAVWALETLSQLVPRNGRIKHLKLIDSPRYSWRGLMLDPARRFLSIGDLKRTIDLMMVAKLNVLHLHLTDDQGFRIESKAFPNLHQKGSNGQYYTQKQMKKLVRYAGIRGIRIVPEFNMPGHMHSWFMGHPELSAGASPKQKARHFGIHHQTLHPKREANRAFIQTFVREMKSIFPDQYWFLGADEVTGKQWEENKSLNSLVKAFAKKPPRDNFLRLNAPYKSKTPGINQLYAHMVRDLVSLIEEEDRKVIVWDDAMDGLLPESTTVASYLNFQDSQETIQKSFTKTKHPILSAEGWYMNTNVPLKKLYDHNPAAYLGKEASQRIQGGIICLWGELISSETLDIRLWPGALAPAEVMWSQPNKLQYSNFKMRLEESVKTLRNRGSNFSGNRKRMLNRLAKGRALTALEELADHLIPIDGRLWRQQKAIKEGINLPPINTDIPLNHFPDTLNAFPKGIRTIETLVDQHLKGNASATKELKMKLTVLTTIPQVLENHKQHLATADYILKSANMVSQWAALGIQAMHPTAKYQPLYSKSQSLDFLNVSVKVGIKSPIQRLIVEKKQTADQ